MKHIFYTTVFVVLFLFCNSFLLMPNNANISVREVCDEYSVPSIECSPMEIKITHSVYSKRITLVTQEHEIVYQKYNLHDSQTRIHISMYPQGTYYICIDADMFEIIL